MISNNSSTNPPLVLLDAPRAYLSIDKFVVGDAKLAQGTFVKLHSSGKVEPCAAGTDGCIGYVAVSNDKKFDTDQLTVTVNTRFSVIMQNCFADGAITIGGVVDASGFDATSKKPKFKATVSTGNKVGIALSGAADLAQTLKVGIL
jgi:hypothetical protein